MLKKSPSQLSRLWLCPSPRPRLHQTTSQTQSRASSTIRIAARSNTPMRRTLFTTVHAMRLLRTIMHPVVFVSRDQTAAHLTQLNWSISTRLKMQFANAGKTQNKSRPC